MAAAVREGAAAPSLPAPLTPLECDLRGLDYMPLLVQHFLGSTFNLTANDAEWRAGLTLLMQAWGQVPAASLPADEGALAALAGLGRDVRTWLRLKPAALRGWVACSDGRLYHPFLAKQASIAMEARVAARERKARWRAEKTKKSKQGNGHVPGTETGTERSGNGPVPSEAKLRDGTLPSGVSCPEASLQDTPAHSGTTGHPGGRGVPPSRKQRRGQDQQKTKQPLSSDQRTAADEALMAKEAQRLMADAGARAAAAARTNMSTEREWLASGRSLRDYASALAMIRVRQGVVVS